MSEKSAVPDRNVEAMLGLEAAGRRRLPLWVWWGSGGLVVLVIAAFFLVNGKGAGIRYTTEPARRGDLTVTVTATGALQPTNEVEVGTEVSGTIDSVMVDYNDVVKTGDVLARLNTDRLEAQVHQSEAALASAKANVAQAKATLKEASEKLERLRKVFELSDGRVPSADEMATAEATLARARATLSTNEALVTEASARLVSDRTNLAKATIHSPIDGIVLQRQVEPGQTVAASLQTPVLFTIAESLKQMELVVAVDEADVGNVREGQHATFTVDAYPDRSYPAQITEVRYQPITTAGVVTYEAVLSVSNDDLSLRPGMTATADIVVQHRENVLLVPNAALRFEPPATAAVERPGFSLLPRPRFRRSANPPRQGASAGSAQVWMLEQNTPKAVPVKTGPTDGVDTEIVSGDVKAGEELLVDYSRTGGGR